MKAETKLEHATVSVQGSRETKQTQKATHEFTRLSRNEDTTQKNFTKFNKYTRGNEVNTSNDTRDVRGVCCDHRLPSYSVGAD